MQQADGPAQPHLRRIEQQHLAAHRAQAGQAVARGEAPAIHHAAARRPPSDRDAAHRQPQAQRGQRLLGVEMPLLGKEQPAREPPGELGLRVARIDGLVAPRRAGEAVELGGVAARRDDQRAARLHAADPVAPPAQGPPPGRDDRPGRDLALAIGGQHPAGQPRGRRRVVLDQLHREAPLGQRGRGAQPRDAGAQDRDRVGAHSPSGR